MKNLVNRDDPATEPVTPTEIEWRRARLCALGFQPAFYDYATCTVHASRHADGRPAAVHLLDGMPEEMVVVRSDCGRVLAARATLIAGFARHGYFYTHASAWRAAREWNCPGHDQAAGEPTA